MQQPNSEAVGHEGFVLRKRNMQQPNSEAVDEGDEGRRTAPNDAVWEGTCEKVKNLLLLPYVPQGSERWHELRKGMLTSSDISTALDVNPYCSSKALFRQKTNKLSIDKLFRGNYATRWGHKYEPMARREYEKRTGEFVYAFSLVAHPRYPWLGGSCDGVTASGRLLEIKCPTSRIITHDIPRYYVPQVQTLLEVLDLEVCDFVQFKPENHNGRGAPMEYDRLVIKRDRQWFAQNFPALEDFWKMVVEERALEDAYQRAAVVFLQRLVRVEISKRKLELARADLRKVFKEVRRPARDLSRRRKPNPNKPRSPVVPEEASGFAFDFSGGGPVRASRSCPRGPCRGIPSRS